MYFEVVSTLALLIGLAVVKLLKPGVGIYATPGSTRRLCRVRLGGEDPYDDRIRLHVIPETAVEAFVGGEILQVLLFSVMLGLAFARSVSGCARAGLWTAQHCCSRSSPDHAIWRRSARSGRWRSPSANTGSGTLLSLGQLMAASI